PHSRGARVPPPRPAPPPRRDDGARRQGAPSATMSSDKVDSAVRRLRTRRPPRILPLAGVLLLGLAISAVLVVRSRAEPLSSSFAGNNLVRFSFRYPGDWQQEGQGVQVVFS